jgi:hypothetical protein
MSDQRSERLKEKLRDIGRRVAAQARQQPQQQQQQHQQGAAAGGAAAAAPPPAAPRLSKRERERLAAGPRFQQQLANGANARDLVRLIVTKGPVTLSAVDLCELAVSCRGFADGVRHFWDAVGARGAAMMAAAAASTAISSAASPAAALAAASSNSARARRASSRPRRARFDASTFPTLYLPASNPLSRLALDYSPFGAGVLFRTRRHAYFMVDCVGCGGVIGNKPAYVDAVGRGCCHACASGWRTAVDPSSSSSPRRLHAHLASVLAPTASRLLGVPLDELVRAVPHHKPHSLALKADRAVRVSLRSSASWALRKHGGPQRMKDAKDLMLRAEATTLSNLSAARGPVHYESLDAYGMDCRRHALRKALTAALEGKEHAHPTADYNVPWSLEQHGGDALLRAAAAHSACGRPSLASIVSTAVEAARLAPLKRGARPARPSARRKGTQMPDWMYEQQVSCGKEEDEEEGGDEEGGDKSGSDEEESDEEDDGHGRQRQEDDDEESESESEEDDDDDDDDDDWGGKKKKKGGKRGRGGGGKTAAASPAGGKKKQRKAGR